MSDIHLWTGTGDPVTDSVSNITDFRGTDSRPPLVNCGYHASPGLPVCFAMHQVVDILAAAAPVLGAVERAQVARNIGALTPAQAEELLAEIERLEAQVESLRATQNVSLAEVIDFVAEREKRRPVELPTVAPVA